VRGVEGVVVERRQDVRPFHEQNGSSRPSTVRKRTGGVQREGVWSSTVVANPRTSAARTVAKTAG